jgi:hypothetical protein
MTSIDLSKYWSDAWENTLEDVRQRVGDEAMQQQFRTANKRKPEDKAWWYTNGLEMLKKYQSWRQESDWKIWTAPDGQPAIELNMMINFGTVPVKMALDRIMQLPDGELVVLDLKTGSRTPSTTLQLGFYSVGIELTYGVKPKYGSYWMARKGEPTPIVDLSWYTSDRLIRLAEMFNRARYEGLFVPNISNCSLCGYTAHCEWYKKEEDKTNV